MSRSQNNNKNKVLEKRKRHEEAHITSTHSSLFLEVTEDGRTKPSSLFPPPKRNALGMTVNEGDHFDVPTLLSSNTRHYLVNNNGDKV